MFSVKYYNNFFERKIENNRSFTSQNKYFDNNPVSLSYLASEIFITPNNHVNDEKKADSSKIMGVSNISALLNTFDGNKYYNEISQCINNNISFLHLFSFKTPILNEIFIDNSS